RWVARVGDFRGPDEQLIVPRDDEDGAAVGRFRVDGRIGRTVEARQDDVRPADAAEHAFFRLDAGLGADHVGPGAGGIDDVFRPDAGFRAGERIAYYQPGDARFALVPDQVQCATVVADYGAGGGGFSQPFGDPAFGKLAPRVVVV